MPWGVRLAELRSVARLIVPVTAAYALQEGADSLIPLWAAGHYRSATAEEVELRLGALGLGTTTLVCLAMVVRSGWTGGQDALVAQAFGRKDFAAARVHLHQCQLWMSALAVVCGLLLTKTESLLTFLGVADAPAAAMAGEYVLACLPGLWFEFQYDALRKFLMNQELPRPGLAVLCATVPAQMIALHVFLQHTQLEFMQCVGAALAMKSMLSLLFLGAYTSWCRPRPSCDGWWWPFHSQAFSLDGLRAYAQLGLPSTATVCCDWWAWEALTLMAGALNSPAELAGHVAAAAASDWLFLAARGAPKAATVLVGAAAGRGDVAGVRAAARACAACCAALCGALALGIWSSRARLVAWMLPGDGLAAVILRRLVPLVVAQLVLDAANSLMDGVFAGLGLQGPASLGTLVCCWIVQLPLAWLLGFHAGLGVVGLRQAALVAALLQVACKLALLRRSIGGSAPAVARAAQKPPLPVGEYAVAGGGAAARWRAPGRPAGGSP